MEDIPKGESEDLNAWRFGGVNVDAKRALLKKDKEINRKRKLRKRKERRCFWTRPFGHAWVPSERKAFEYVCVGCGKERFTYLDGY